MFRLVVFALAACGLIAALGVETRHNITQICMEDSAMVGGADYRVTWNMECQLWSPRYGAWVSAERYYQ